MLERPRRRIRAGLPRLSRSWTLGTVKRTASQAVLAPEAAMTSAVITVPRLGAAARSMSDRAPPQPVAPTNPSHTTCTDQKTRRGRSTSRPPSQTSTGQVSVHDGIGHDVLDRVHRFVVHPDLVVQMRARGQSGRAYERDFLPALHALTADRENLGAVSIPGHEPEAMIDRDHVAISLFPLDVGDHTGGGRLDLGAHRGAHVDTLVRAREVENRVHTFAHEGARQPALGWHDRRRGRKPLALAGEGLVRFVERSH